MDACSAHILNYTTSSFYLSQTKSFSDTRASAWTGWDKLIHLLSEPTAPAVLSVLDVGCGNLRFEKYLRSQLPATSFDFYAVDNCEQLLNNDVDVTFISQDIIGNLIDEQPLFRCVSQCDLSVAFGLLHHVPSYEWRLDLLEQIISQTKKCGLVGISFWQFERDKKLFMKAQASHARALEHIAIDPRALDVHDYLLGWQDTTNVFRYCHHFTDAEVDSLIEDLKKKARVVADYNSDGHTGNLNRYVIWQVC